MSSNSFDPERYNRRSGNSSQTPDFAGVDQSRQRIVDLLAKRDKNATKEAEEYYREKAAARREARQAKQHSKRGWGKAAMLGGSIGSMFGPAGAGVGAGIGTLLGLGSAADTYGGGLSGGLKALTNVGEGVFDPVMENPMLAASTAASVAPFFSSPELAQAGEYAGITSPDQLVGQDWAAFGNMPGASGVSGGQYPTVFSSGKYTPWWGG